MTVQYSLTDDKNPPPCMQLQAGVGFFRPKTTHPLACNCETGWVSCSFSLRQRTTTSHVGSSSSSASVCTHDTPTTMTITHPLACNCETGWILFFYLRQR